MHKNELSEFESHLDGCDSCRHRLSIATAEDSWWSEAKEYLTEDGSQQELGETLSFLNPTDNPRMMGRFGGYEIAGLIGQGGMGIVLKGFDDSLNRYAAIKVLAPQLATRGSSRNRFAREAQAAAAVVHDNVIAIHGVSEAAGLPFLVMPYVRGESLQKRLDRDGAMTPTEIVRIAHQIASGLAAAHAQGLVHRDIKPANILLPEGVQRVLITDFGLARAVDDSNLTGTGILAGTPQFMSPEQARGDIVDPRSDLFSLGTVIYSMCTGRNPFRASNPYGILRRIIEDKPRPVRQVNPEIPAWLDSIVVRLHEKSPNDRYQSAAELAELLEKCLAHLQNSSIRLPEELKRRKHVAVDWKWAVFGTMVAALLIWGALFLPQTLKTEQRNWLANYLPWISPLSDVEPNDSVPDFVSNKKLALQAPRAGTVPPKEWEDEKDRRQLSELQDIRDAALEKLNTARKEIESNSDASVQDTAKLRDLQDNYLAIDKEYRMALAFDQYEKGEFETAFENLRNASDIETLIDARAAALEAWRTVQNQFDSGSDSTVQNVAMVKDQYYYFDQQVNFRMLQNEVFRGRAKAERQLAVGDVEDSLITLLLVSSKIMEAELDDKLKNPLLTIIERDTNDVRAFAKNPLRSKPFSRTTTQKQSADDTTIADLVANLAQGSPLRGQWKINRRLSKNGDETADKTVREIPGTGFREFAITEEYLIGIGQASDQEFKLSKLNLDSSHDPKQMTLIMRQADSAEGETQQEVLKWIYAFKEKDGVAVELTIAMNDGKTFPESFAAEGVTTIGLERISQDHVALELEAITSLRKAEFHLKQGRIREHEALVGVSQSFRREAGLWLQRQKIRHRNLVSQSFFSENEKMLMDELAAKATKERSARSEMVLQDKHAEDLRERLTQFSNLITSLHQEGNFIEAKLVEREMLLDLRSSDKDHQRLNELRQKMIEMRLEGKHNEADRVVDQMNRSEKELSLRYAEIERINDLMKKVDEQLTPLKNRLSELGGAENPDGDAIIEIQKRIEDTERAIIRGFKVQQKNIWAQIDDETAAWDPGDRTPLALAGLFDLDDDGECDLLRMVQLIKDNGGNVVVQHDDRGAIFGKIDSSVRYLVIGETEGASEEVLRAIEELKNQAEKVGVEVVGCGRLFAWMGFDENEILDAQIAIKRASLKAGNAAETLDHSKKLLAKGFVTEQQVASDRLNLEVAQLELAKAENLLNGFKRQGQNSLQDGAGLIPGDANSIEKNDTTDAQIAIIQATLKVSNAEETLDHSRKLLAKGFVTEQQVARDGLNLEVAQLELAKAENLLNGFRKSRRDGTRLNSGDANSIEEIEKTIREFQSQIVLLEDTLGNEHPKIKSLLRQIEFWEKQRDELKSKE